MSTKPFTFEFPKLFKRLKSQHNDVVKHWIALREKKQYRNEQQAVLVQGYKTIKELREQKVLMRSLVVTAKAQVPDASLIKEPAASILRQPHIFPAKHYFLTDIDLTRRILGTASKPGNHDIFAEVLFPKLELPDMSSVEKVLVLDRISDPGNMGTLVRTARALGWNVGLISSTSCDLYNDKVIRASRALSLTWPHKTMESSELINYLKSNDITPIVADMMPDDPSKSQIWSPERENDVENKATLGSGLWFWNESDANDDQLKENEESKKKKKIQELPKRIALILSSEHGGVKGLKDELRVSIPMNGQVESLNVAVAGAILMSELNRLNCIQK